MLSKAITTTKRCAIIVFTFFTYSQNTQKAQIQRGGVDKTTNTVISAIDFAYTGGYGHMQYALEILDYGTYTYNLVNTSGGNLSPAGLAMDIVAVYF